MFHVGREALSLLGEMRERTVRELGRAAGFCEMICPERWQNG